MALHTDKIDSLGIRKGKAAFLHRLYENRRFMGVLPYRKQVRARAFYVPAPGFVADKVVYAETVRENRADWNHRIVARKPAAERMLTDEQAMGHALI